MPTDQPTVPVRIRPDSREYERSVVRLADYFMRLVPCKMCGAARNHGYICIRCGGE